jgi:hypothetical protein
VKARARTTRSTAVGWILARVHHLEVTMEQEEIEPGVWLPVRIALDLDWRLLFDRDRMRWMYSYADYERVAAASASARTAASARRAASSALIPGSTWKGRPKTHRVRAKRNQIPRVGSTRDVPSR